MTDHPSHVAPQHSEAQHSEANRRPSALDLLAALLLAGTVVLHVVAMFFTYYTGSPNLASQADQASLYGVLAGAWALALAFGLTGPHRTPIAAGLAGGVALGEIGFRISDVGQAIRYGTHTVGMGLWLMAIAWGVGALGALVAWLAAHRRHRTSGAEAGVSADGPAMDDLTTDAAAVGSVVEGPNPYDPDTTTEFIPDKTVPTPVAGVRTDTQVIPAIPDSALAGVAHAGEAHQPDHERLAWTILVVVLAGLTAGVFLPAWDHGVAVSGVDGRTVFSQNLGNAFSGPWIEVVGNSVAAAMFFLVPIVGIRLKNKLVGAALTCGVLLALAAQFVSAVVQASQPVQPSTFGFSPNNVQEFGLSLRIDLTGWFTVNALAAYALFAVMVVWANLRAVEARPPAPARAGTQPGQSWGQPAQSGPWGQPGQPGPWGQPGQPAPSGPWGQPGQPDHSGGQSWPPPAPYPDPAHPDQPWVPSPPPAAGSPPARYPGSWS